MVLGPPGPGGPRQAGVQAPADDVEILVRGAGRIAGRVIDAASREPVTEFTVAFEPEMPQGGPRCGWSARRAGSAVSGRRRGRRAISRRKLRPRRRARGHVDGDGRGPGLRDGPCGRRGVRENETTADVEVRATKGRAVRGRVLDAATVVRWSAPPSRPTGRGAARPPCPLASRTVRPSPTPTAASRSWASRWARASSWPVTRSTRRRASSWRCGDVTRRRHPAVERRRARGRRGLGGRRTGGRRGGIGPGGRPGRHALRDGRRSRGFVGPPERRRRAVPRRSPRRRPLLRHRVAPRPHELASRRPAAGRRIAGGSPDRARGRGHPARASRRPRRGALSSANVTASGPAELLRGRASGQRRHLHPGRCARRVDRPPRDGRRFHDGSRTASTQVQIAEGQTEADAEIVFEPVGVIAGRVTRAGEAVAEVMLSASPPATAGPGAFARSDASGGYRIEGLRDGSYTVTASPPRGAPSDSRSRCGRGHPRLRAAPRPARGHVVEAGSGLPLAEAEVEAEGQRDRGTAVAAAARPSPPPGHHRQQRALPDRRPRARLPDPHGTPHGLPARAPHGRGPRGRARASIESS